MTRMLRPLVLRAHRRQLDASAADRLQIFNRMFAICCTARVRRLTYEAKLLCWLIRQLRNPFCSMSQRKCKPLRTFFRAALDSQSRKSMVRSEHAVVPKPHNIIIAPKGQACGKASCSHTSTKKDPKQKGQRKKEISHPRWLPQHYKHFNNNNHITTSTHLCIFPTFLLFRPH
jgi:hypothetical protein